MSRKITSFLCMLVALFMSVSAFAQLDELQLKTVTVGEVVAEFQPNTWYFLHQGRTPSQGNHQYAPTLAGEVPSTGGFLYDQGIGKDILKIGVVNVDPESTATSKANYLVRFVPTENEGAYNIQFGTGNWLTGPASNAQSAKFSSTDNKYDAGEFNLYVIDPEGAPGAIGFNVYDMSWRVDNNISSETGINAGNTVVTWDSGKHEIAIGDDGMINSNSIWSVAEIIWGEADPLEAAARDLETTYDQYAGYSGTFTVGTEPGQYGEAEVAAFEAALLAAYNAAEDALGPDNVGGWTPETLNEVKQALIDAYNAVLESKVSSELKSGYYRIKNGYRTDGHSRWYETVTDEETQEEVTVYVDKYMTSAVIDGTIYGRWGGIDPEDVTTQAPALWIVTSKGDGTYDIQNAVTKGRFNNVKTSTSVTMDENSENLMALDPVITLDGVMYVDIRVSTQAANGYLYLHTGGHSSGAGKSGYLVGWATGYSAGSTDLGATEWSFEAVSDEEANQILADYEPYANHDKLVAEYNELLADAKAKLELAKDEVSEALITKNEQFSSPWTEPSEGSLNNLLDGDTNTFWHSAWSNGSVDGHTHYLQVALDEVVDKEIYLAFSRRTTGDNHAPVANDHITQWSVYGSSSADADDASWVELAAFETPYSSSEINMTTDPFLTQGNQYLRFYADSTTSSRGYWHVGEFQLYTVPEPNPNAQYNHMGDLATNLESVIEEQDGIEADDIDMDVYNKLKAAYDAFMTKYVDPTELRNTLKELAGTADVVEVGTQPGFWSADNGAGAFMALYDEAVAYDAAGDYTPEQSQNYIDKLTAQSQDIYASAIAVQPGKWYKIRFGTQEEFEAHEWDLVAGNGTEKVPELFGKYISLADFEQDGDGYQSIDPVADRDAIALGDKLYFLADENIQVTDDAMFRFVAVGDSAYLLQNKTSGLFVRAAGTSGAVTLSAHPTLFTVRAIGYGQNVISAKNLTGSYQSNLHAQVNQNVLVTWDVDYPGSRSGLYIEEAGDVAADFDGTEFNVPVILGAVNTYCFPVEISVADGQTAKTWGVQSLEDTKVTLSEITGPVAGGRPFILVNGDVENYDAEAAANGEYDMVVLKHGYEVTAEPQTDKPLKGSYYGQTVGAGVLVAEGNTFVMAKRSNTSIGINSAYIAAEEPFTDLEATVEVIFGAGGDAIQTALANVTKSGAVYTIDGRLVSPKANLNDLSRFGKGIYILNGTKVVVK